MTEDQFQPETPADLNPIKPEIQIDCARRINFASAQNAVAILRSLAVNNPTDASLSNLKLKMTAEPAFLKSKTWTIDSISAGDSPFKISGRNVQFDMKKLAGLNEAERGQLVFQLFHADTILLCETVLDVELLARDEWGGLQDMAQFLAAFVAPNDPAIAGLIKEAGHVLEQAGHDPSLNGYQSGDPKRAWMLTAAAWSAVSGLGLTYAQPPRSFERTGQKIRDPSRVTNEKLATCLDITLLMAGLLEAIGLNPAAIFTTDHAFVGVWLVNKNFASIAEFDITEIRKAIAAREFIAFETTLLTSRPARMFEDAIKETCRHLNEEAETDFAQVIDIALARTAKIRPLASHRPVDQKPTDRATPVPLPSPPDFGTLPSESANEHPATSEGRIERWQRKLLDLSMRNRLLNFSDTKQTIPFVCSNVAALEDKLAEGKAMRVISLDDQNPTGTRDPDLFRRETGQNIHEEFTRQALERNEVCVSLPEHDMKARLTTLFRKAKSDMAEGGTNTLFLAVGFLRWKRMPEDTRTYRAPILLLPVSLTRKSALSSFYLRHYEDEVRINATLLEHLSQNFTVQVPTLADELPTDQSGLDLPRIFDAMRQAVRDVPGFEVIENLALSTFSFAKYLIWKDLVDRTDSLRNNRLVKHLIDSPEVPYTNGVSTITNADKIDQRFDPKDLVTPLPTDSSQLAAVAAAGEGHDMVIIGPPGTGKSQTIANMIAHCLAKGKSVLFVAEKSAALNVVYRRLKAHGLDNACLELHSNKADRRSVLAQLGAAWDRALTTQENEWVTITNRLKIRRDELNAYVNALHAPGSHGQSIFNAIGIIAGYTDTPAFTLQFGDQPDVHDKESFQRLLDIFKKASRSFEIVSAVDGLASITHTDWSHAWQRDLLTQAQTLRDAGMTLLSVANNFKTSLGQPGQNNISLEHMERLCLFAKAIEKIASDDYSRVSSDVELDQLRAGLNDLKTTIRQIRHEEGELSARYAYDIVTRIPIDKLDREWREANAKIWAFSWLSRRRIRKLLQGYADSGMADPDRDIGPLGAMAGHLARIDNSNLRTMPNFQGVDTNTEQFGVYLENAATFLSTLTDLKRMVADADALIRRTEPLLREGSNQQEPARQALALLDAKTTFEAALTAYRGTAGDEPRCLSLTELQVEMNHLRTEHGRIHDWTRWVESRKQAVSARLEPLVEAIEQRQLRSDQADAVFRKAYMAWWLPLSIDAQPILREFTYWEHQDKITNFCALHEKAQKLAEAQVARAVAHNLPTRDGVPRKSELGVLRHQLNLQRPSTSIRNLISFMPTAFAKLAPCVLMSPLSIAQYLPTKHTQFDMVIFDEASQITTWDAIGAIARGQQSVIVGDPKQLPPTNFFARSTSDEDDDQREYEKDLPSILDEASVAGLHRISLNWHYRSRNEALIAFSNHHYYGDRLITFPSPSTGTNAVRLHQINDGVYGRGKDRTNDKEAREIVAMIVDRLTKALTCPENERETIGVVTFNVQQQEKILDLLDVARRKNSKLEWFFEDAREEPVIVKNLENIQGDERDVMLFSITYGTDKTGRMPMTFGAINKDGGEKRLNVAITRARSELHVFASFTADMIDLKRTNSLGVRHLKNFLDYAERGPKALPNMDEGELGPAENPFEEAVATALKTRGWEIRTQVGVSGYRIDLGVVHPDRAGAYLAGIECDGATYHSSANARDRDQIRESVLRNLGWEIIRIWSTDWFANSSETCNRTHQELERLLAISR